MTRDPMDEAVGRIFGELRLAEEKFPGWPDDVVHGAAIMAEESGEAVQAALDHYYRPNSTSLDQLKVELSQTGAMALRMLVDIIKKDIAETHYDLNVVRKDRDCG